MFKFIYTLSACMMLTSGAMAAHIHVAPSGDQYEAHYPFAGTPSRAQTGSCVTICGGDTYPCDPLNFKRADGRCSL